MSVKENEQYGDLTTLRVVGRTSARNLIWECLCSCGNTINVPTGSLTTGNTKSCGCLHEKSMQKMGKEQRQLNEYRFIENVGVGRTLKDDIFYFDLEDFELIKEFTWMINDKGYVLSRPFGGPIRMHVLIMKKYFNENFTEKDIDHINGMKNDNRKENLRICEHFQNLINSKMYSNNTTGRKGVYWDKSREKWKASITFNKRTIELGRFDNFDDAVFAREEAEKKYHGEFTGQNSFNDV